MYQVHAKILTVAKTRENMYIPLEWIEDIYAIAYYSIIRNATAHMHRKCFFNIKGYIYIYMKYMNIYIQYIYLLRMLCTLTCKMGF